MRKNSLFKFLVLLLLTPLVVCGAYAQDRVSGKVTADGEPLIGAVVKVQGTNQGAVADIDGNYSISAKKGDTLVFSFLGYTSQTVVVGDNLEINVNLSASSNQLDEVVVTALGISRERKSLGYAITQIGGSDVSTAKETNVVSSLSGKVAGVVLTQSTSGPAGGVRIVLRGNNSITGNNQPLFVIDGIPVDNTGIGSAAEDGGGEFLRQDYGTGISDINPEDIESITVLKGANAAALYGSRAGNGVILITTKKGTVGTGLGVSFSSNLTFETPLLLPKYQNQYGRGSEGNFPTSLEDLKQRNSWGPRFDGSSKLYFTGENTTYSAVPDNVKNFFDTGETFTNAVTLSSGTEKSSILFSYTNTNAGSILPNSYVRRHNFNLRASTALSDKLSLDFKATYFYQDAKNRASQGTEGVLAYLYTLPRNIVTKDLMRFQDINNPEDPANPYNVISWMSGSFGNPYWLLNHDVREDSRNRIYGFAKIDYKIANDLSAFVRVGTDVIVHDYILAEQFGHHFYGKGRLAINESAFSSTNVDFLLSYNKNLSDSFNLSASAGGNYEYSTAKRIGINGQDFKLPVRPIVDNLVDPMQSHRPLSERKVNSLYGTFSLGYKNFLYLDLTGRNDWSSTLSAENRSYFYPSASLSFILSEAFNMQGANVDLLKLRSSWADVGNDTGLYNLRDYYELAADGYLGLTQLATPRDGLRLNLNLRPESSVSLEFGLELRMFKDRLFADISYYSIQSKDLIFESPDPSPTYERQLRNLGLLTNKGFEILIGGTPYKSNNFSWDISANFAQNENKLERLIDDLQNFTFASNNGGNVQVFATVGGGFGEIWGRTWKRVPDGPNQGKLVVDAEGRPLADATLVKLGNYQPDATGGITNAFTYKNLKLQFLVDFRIGGEVYSGTDAALDASGVSERTLQYRDGITVDGVVEDGSGGYTQNTNKISGQQYWGSVSGIASEYVYSQTNVRLRELTLSYKIPSKALSKTFIKNISISLVVRNLFFLYKEIDNFDPESSYSTSNFSQGVLYYNLPTNRSIGFNLNVKF